MARLSTTNATVPVSWVVGQDSDQMRQPVDFKLTHYRVMATTPTAYFIKTGALSCTLAAQVRGADVVVRFSSSANLSAVKLFGVQH